MRQFSMVLGSILCAATAFAQSRLTFEEALARALAVNNNIEQAEAEIGAADANRRFIRSAVLPKVNLTGSATRNSIERSFGSGDDETNLLPRTDWNYRVVLSQPLFAGWRDLRAYSQARLGVTNAREQKLGTEDSVLLRVASNYLAAVNADARIEVERRNIELAQKREKTSQAFFEAGEVTRIDVLRAQTAMKAAQRLLALAQQNREAAVGRLRVDLDLDGALEVVPPKQLLPPLSGEAALIERAESRPDVLVAQNNLKIADLEVRKQRGFWYPTVTFDGGLLRQKSTFPADSYSYGALRLTVPLFQSGEVQARVAGAKQLEIEARLALENALLEAREDVRKALVDLETAEMSLGLAREQLAAAEAEYSQAFELYRAQEATSLDLAASESSLAEARRAVAEETLNRDEAALRVWFAAGTLKDAVGVKSP